MFPYTTFDENSSNLDYDSFGNVTGASASTRYTYTGRELDADTGLIYCRSRFYDPQQGDSLAKTRSVSRLAWICMRILRTTLRGSQIQWGRTPLAIAGGVVIVEALIQTLRRLSDTWRHRWPGKDRKLARHPRDSPPSRSGATLPCLWPVAPAVVC